MSNVTTIQRIMARVKCRCAMGCNAERWVSDVEEAIGLGVPLTGDERDEYENLNVRYRAIDDDFHRLVTARHEFLSRLAMASANSVREVWG